MLCLLKEKIFLLLLQPFLCSSVQRTPSCVQCCQDVNYLCTWQGQGQMDLCHVLKMTSLIALLELGERHQGLTEQYLVPQWPPVLYREQQKGFVMSNFLWHLDVKCFIKDGKQSPRLRVCLELCSAVRARARLTRDQFDRDIGAAHPVVCSPVGGLARLRHTHLERVTLVPQRVQVIVVKQRVI